MNDKKFNIILLSAFLIGSITLLSYANTTEINIMTGIERMSGDSTYQIGGKVETTTDSGYVRFPISELMFPLDIYMASVGCSVDIEKKWNFRTYLKKSTTRDAGKMEDSDWGINYYEIDWWMDPNSLDIYSESDAELDALKFELNIQYSLLNEPYEYLNLLITAGCGFLYQKYDFEVSNLDQWYPSLNEYFGYDIGHDYEKGKVLTYEINYSIPYIMIGTKFDIQDIFYISAEFGYSPFARAEDEDDHILRSKISKGDCDGDAKLLSLELLYSIPWIDKMFLMLDLDYFEIDTKGESKSYIDGYYDHTINQKITSKQISTSLSIGYRF